MNAMQDWLALIQQYDMVVRPSLTMGWIVGKFKGVTGDGKVYIFPETACERPTLKEAITEGAQKIQAFNDYLDEFNEAVVIEQGFDSYGEFFRMVANIDLTDGTTFQEFLHWRETDGTKEGLLKLKQRSKESSLKTF